MTTPDTEALAKRVAESDLVKRLRDYGNETTPEELSEETLARWFARAATSLHAADRIEALERELAAHIKAMERDPDTCIRLVGQLHKRIDAAELALTTAPRDAGESVCAEIVSIMEEYDRQNKAGSVDTPGGLEHMGDVWRLLDSWRARLTQKEPT